jgi:ubiquinone/menaquinone biosynthesis C-methylase UbiE
VDGLLDRGYTDLTVVDLSEGALAKVKGRLGERASGVRFVQGDARHLQLDGRIDLWHDRAVFHFLTAAEDRAAYLDTVGRTLRPGGHVVLATFALDGPETCSGLSVQRYSPRTLGEALGEGYRLVRSLERTHVTPTKKEQRFTYAVFRWEDRS